MKVHLPYCVILYIVADCKGGASKYNWTKMYYNYRVSVHKTILASPR